MCLRFHYVSSFSIPPIPLFELFQSSSSFMLCFHYVSIDFFGRGLEFEHFSPIFLNIFAFLSFFNGGVNHVLPISEIIAIFRLCGSLNHPSRRNYWWIKQRGGNKKQEKQAKWPIWKRCWQTSAIWWPWRRAGASQLQGLRSELYYQIQGVILQFILLPSSIVYIRQYNTILAVLQT